MLFFVPLGMEIHYCAFISIAGIFLRFCYSITKISVIFAAKLGQRYTLIINTYKIHRYGIEG